MGRCKKNLEAEKVQERKKKLLVLDMDETLVHSRHETFGDKADLCFTLVKGGCNYYVKLRPGVRVFLDKVAKLFEVMIFTASDQEYADKVIDFLDPGKTLISRRAYIGAGRYVESDGYVKDLSALERSLAEVVIIDNNPHHFRLQKENGIPITSWYVDPNDEELASLLPFLERLVGVEDVRPLVAEAFGTYKGGCKKKKRNIAVNTSASSLVKPMQNLNCKGKAVRSMETKEVLKRTTVAFR